jgi:hypothetical protein
MTAQELLDWLEGVLDPDGLGGVDPNAAVRVALDQPSGKVSLSIETMSGERLLLTLDPEPIQFWR